MKTIEIQEISNGFVVELFDKRGPSNLDRTVFCKDWKEVTKAIDEWFEDEDNKAKP
jgi:hypothetical protein